MWINDIVDNVILKPTQIMRLCNFIDSHWIILTLSNLNLIQIQIIKILTLNNFNLI
jgi:hypothetical protein